MKAPTAIEVMESPYAHDYLKKALQVFLSKDAVDAVNDAEILLKILKNRLNAIQGGVGGLTMTTQHTPGPREDKTMKIEIAFNDGSQIALDGSKYSLRDIDFKKQAPRVLINSLSIFDRPACSYADLCSLIGNSVAVYEN